MYVYIPALCAYNEAPSYRVQNLKHSYNVCMHLISLVWKFHFCVTGMAWYNTILTQLPRAWISATHTCDDNNDHNLNTWSKHVHQQACTHLVVINVVSVVFWSWPLWLWPSRFWSNHVSSEDHLTGFAWYNVLCLSGAWPLTTTTSLETSLSLSLSEWTSQLETAGHGNSCHFGGQKTLYMLPFYNVNVNTW